ncbi:MAG: hypothetical protein ABL984_05665 [Pyrinomonadaceae bacterium]
MSRQKLTIIDLNILDGLTTKRLLARLKRIHQCEESKDRSDLDANYKSAAGVIESKDSPEWEAEYNYIKNLLSTRDNISK